MYGFDLEASEVVTNEQLAELNHSMRRKIRKALSDDDNWLRIEDGWRRKGTAPDQPETPKEPEVTQDAPPQAEPVTEDQEQSTEVEAEVQEAPEEPETLEQPTEEIVEAPKPKAKPRKRAAPKSDQ